MTPTMTPTRMTAWLEQAWLVRYLDRQLAREEADWFEAYALDKPELLAMIEVDTRLRDALAADVSVRHMERSAENDNDGRLGGAARQALTPRLPDAAPVTAAAAEHAALSNAAGAESSQRRFIRKPPVWLAMAASLLVGVCAGWFAVRVPDGGHNLPIVIASPTRIIYDTMRGAETLPRIEHADSTSPYVLIQVAVPPGAENIALRMTDATPLTLTAAPDGFASFLVERRSFANSADTRVEYDLHGKKTQLRVRLVE